MLLLLYSFVLIPILLSPPPTLHKFSSFHSASICSSLQAFTTLSASSLSPQQRQHHHHHFAAAFDHFPFVGCFHLWSLSITERKRKRRRRSSRTRSRAHLFTSTSSFFVCGTNSWSAKLEINLALSLGGRRVWKRNSSSSSSSSNTMMALQLVSSFCSCCINDGFSSVVTRVM